MEDNALKKFNTAKFLSFGLAIGILIQATLNLAVVIGLIPVTGVTLPFFSYGGSSLLTSMISIGMILGISRNSHWKKMPWTAKIFNGGHYERNKKNNIFK